MSNDDKINELLALHPDAVIWEHEINTESIYRKFTIFVLLYAFVAYAGVNVLFEIGIKRFMLEEPEGFLTFLPIIGIAIVMVTTHMTVLVFLYPTQTSEL